MCGKPANAIDWHELGETEHFVQFFDDSRLLVESAADFVGQGLQLGEAAVVIANSEHLAGIEQALERLQIDLRAARAEGRYIAADAAETLAKLLADGCPAPERFHAVVGTMIAAANASAPRTRVFGEMVALLWGERQYGAAIRLEDLWNELAKARSFALFCAYPLAGMDEGPVEQVCSTQSRVIPAADYDGGTDAQSSIAVIERLQQKVAYLQRQLEQRKALERLLAKRERELADFLENAVVALHKVGRDGTILWANKAELELLGYPPAEYIGRSFADFYVDDAAAHSVLRRLLDGEVLRDAPARIRCKDGSIKDVRISSNALWEKGEFVSTRCSTRDVTAELRAEEMVRKSQERQRQLTEMLEQRVAERTEALLKSKSQVQQLVAGISDCGLYMLDVNGRVANWNPGAEKLHGYTRSEIVGRHLSVLYTPEDRASGLADRVLESAALDGKYEAEAWRMRKDGTRFFASVLVDAIYDRDGKLAGFAKMTRDMTERRALQEQLHQSQKMEAIGQLTGGVAHDFNNLLTVILGNLETVWRQVPPDKGRLRRAVDQATRGAQRAATLTQQLLAFSRRQPLDPKAIDVNRLVRGMSDLVRRTIGESIAVETVLAGGLWRVEVDPNQLESALINLAVNARDAMHEGGKLTIETANAHLDETYAASFAEITPGQYVAICISDTGTGMPKDVMARAFDPFFTTKPLGEGTGLGLSQVYGFVKQSNGHIKLYSEVGQGTTVKIYLPRLLDAEGRTEHERAAIVPEGQPHETILVVEDDDDVRLYSTDSLRELGFTVLEATEGASALRILEEHPEVSLLFTDVGLPGINGRQLVDQARQRRPNLCVLFTTGYARNAIVHQGRLDQGVELLTKPFTRAQLASRIRDVLDGP